MNYERIASEYLVWCSINHNSPDSMNLRWWIENRTDHAGKEMNLADAMSEVRALKEIGDSIL